MLPEPISIFVPNTLLKHCTHLMCFLPWGCIASVLWRSLDCLAVQFSHSAAIWRVYLRCVNVASRGPWKGFPYAHRFTQRPMHVSSEQPLPTIPSDKMSHLDQTRTVTTRVCTKSCWISFRPFEFTSVLESLQIHKGKKTLILSTMKMWYTKF